jgi:hypothetical protein
MKFKYQKNCRTVLGRHFSPRLNTVGLTRRQIWLGWPGGRGAVHLVYGHRARGSRSGAAPGGSPVDEVGAGKQARALMRHGGPG